MERKRSIYLYHFLFKHISTCTSYGHFYCPFQGIVAYGFARFKFPGRNVLFMLMTLPLCFPNAPLLLSPRYLIFKQLGWIKYLHAILDASALCMLSFLHFYANAIFTGNSKRLDEAARVDGCNPFMIYVRILFPLMKPAMFSRNYLPVPLAME